MERLIRLARDLEQRGQIKLDECWQFQRGGGAGVGKTKRGKGCKVMAIADRAGLPVALSTAARRMRRFVR